MRGTAARRGRARPKPRRTKAIPRNAARRAQAPQPPRAVELYYLQALRRVAASFARAVGKLLYPRIAEFAKAPAEERTDAEDEDEPDAAELAQDLRDAAARAFDEEAFISSADTAAARTVAHSKNESNRLRLPKLTKEPTLKTLLDGWRKDNVARIKSIQADQLDKVEALLRRGQGMRADTLAKELERQVEDVTKSRAEFIAVDQVLTLNAQVTRARHAAAGIERFVWTTSNDERVRDSHAEIDGETFTYDDPPIVDDEPALPGEPPLCRCIPYPLLEELEDEGLE